MEFQKQGSRLELMVLPTRNGMVTTMEDQRTVRSRGVPKVEVSIGNYGTAIRRWIGIQDGTST